MGTLASGRSTTAICVSVAAISLLAACGGVTGQPSSEPTPSNGPISFSRFDSTASHVFVMDPAGGPATKLTSGPGVQAHSAWSPDGTQVAYSQINDTDASIMRVDSTGTGTVLLHKAAWSIVPSWSPDGQRIAFTSDSDGNFEIYSMAADGSDVKQITFTDPPTMHVGPKYSPDGSQLLYAFKSAADAEKPIQDLWIMNTDGSSPKQLTFGYDNTESRTWSPDGHRIAFNSITNGVGQIFVMNADGTGIQQLTQDPAATPTFAPGGIFPGLRGSVTPAWSPDGRSIAYASNREGNYEVYTMDPDGTNVVRITDSPAEELSVGWSPDPQDES